MSEIPVNIEDLLEKELETLQTARSIEALLNNLNLGYKEGLEALANLKSELEAYINKFYQDNAQLDEKLAAAKKAIDEVMKQMEEIQPEIESIYELAQKTETSLQRLEEINTNVIQIEQRIKSLIDGINLKDLEEFAKNLKEELETFKSQKIDEIKNALVEETELAINAIKDLGTQVQNLILEGKKAIEELLKNALEQIQKYKKEALDEIAEAGGIGWSRVLQNCITTKNHALSTLASKRVEKDKFDRIGSVVNLVARVREIPKGFVKPNTPLSIIDYAMLFHLSGSKSDDGKTFTINLPSAGERDFIYSGKEN